MGNGFLDDLPELDIETNAPRRKKRVKPEPAGTEHEAVVIWHDIKCPYRDCGSEDTYVAHSDPLTKGCVNKIRRHKCRECGRTFKSVQRIEK